MECPQTSAYIGEKDLARVWLKIKISRSTSPITCVMGGWYIYHRRIKIEIDSWQEPFSTHFLSSSGKLPLFLPLLKIISIFFWFNTPINRKSQHDCWFHKIFMCIPPRANFITKHFTSFVGPQTSAYIGEKDLARVWLKIKISRSTSPITCVMGGWYIYHRRIKFETDSWQAPF